MKPIRKLFSYYAAYHQHGPLLLRYLSVLGLVVWTVVRHLGPRLAFFYRNVLPGLIVSVVLFGVGVLALGGVAFLAWSWNTKRWPFALVEVSA